MKKSVLFMLLTVVSFIGILEVKADCSVVKADASNITVKTEKSIEKVHVPDENNEGYEEDYEIVKIYTVISNLKDGMYVKVTNDFDNEELTLGYSDSENGVLKVEAPTIYKRVNFKINVYGSSEVCDEVVKEETITTESYNVYTNSDKCSQNKDLDVCDPFYDANKFTKEEFEDLVDKERERVDEENKTFVDKALESLSKYWIFILIPLVVIVGFFVVRIVILKRGKNNE